VPRGLPLGNDSQSLKDRAGCWDSCIWPKMGANRDSLGRCHGASHEKMTMAHLRDRQMQPAVTHSTAAVITLSV